MPRRMSVCQSPIQTRTPSESNHRRDRAFNTRDTPRSTSAQQGSGRLPKNDFSSGQPRRQCSSRPSWRNRHGQDRHRRAVQTGSTPSWTPCDKEIGVELVTSSDLGDRCAFERSHQRSDASRPVQIDACARPAQITSCNRHQRCATSAILNHPPPDSAAICFSIRERLEFMRVVMRVCQSGKTSRR